MSDGGQLWIISNLCVVSLQAYESEAIRKWYR